uniref:Uncharacterized protein n=1 Tax=Leersia perrieri TaxID=77586 RepID=A0A0D9X291_9ORYZ
MHIFRMFCPNRSEYQLFFRTRGALRPFSWNRVIVVICLNDVAVFLASTKSKELHVQSVHILMLVAATLPFPRVHKCKAGPLRHATSQLSPLVVMLLLVPCLLGKNTIPAPKGNLLIARVFYTLLLVMVLLLTITKLQFPSIIRQVNRPVIRKSLSCHQIPASVIRVVIAFTRLLHQNYYGKGGHTNDSDKTNLKPTLNVFYGMVLGQGILYLVTRTMEFFSFFPRRSLARLGGFRGEKGVKSIDMYYSHAFEKCMNASILAPKKMNLTTFAMESLESGPRKEQLCGVQILYSLVNREPYDKPVLSKVANSVKTVTTLIQMLGWVNPEDNQIRLLAAKIIAQLASGLQIVTIPGAMNFISSLLDNPRKQQIEELKLQKDSGGEENCWILKLWHQMAKRWSVLEEEQWMESDIFPVLGLVTLERLAKYDLVNCVEISRSMELIPKITEFMSNNSERMRVNETIQKVLIDMSLKVLRRLARIGGETGITLRSKISEDPFLLSNLAEILEDRRIFDKELTGLTIDILTKLAMNESTRQEIGSIQVIVQRLMCAFVAQDGLPGARSDCLMTVKAGQALSMLTLESADNCSAMMKEPGHRFFKDLVRVLTDNRYTYIAANVLQNLCRHSKVELADSDLVEPSSVLPEVLGRVIGAEGKELEVLVGLSSQICCVSPEMYIHDGAELSSCNIFSNQDLMEALIRVEKTPSRAEKYRFFLGNTGLIEHRVRLPSLVERAKQLMVMHST